MATVRHAPTTDHQRAMRLVLCASECAMTFVHAVAAHSSVASQLAEHLHPEHGAGLLSVSAPSHCCLLLAHILYYRPLRNSQTLREGWGARPQISGSAMVTGAGGGLDHPWSPPIEPLCMPLPRRGDSITAAAGRRWWFASRRWLRWRRCCGWTARTTRPTTAGSRSGWCTCHRACTPGTTELG
jgi:hypothetical protein